MKIDRFFKKKYEEDNETCDKVLKLIDELLLSDIKHTINYEYFEDVNNTIIKIQIYDYISNYNNNNLNVKNNIVEINKFTNFFVDKCELVIRAYTNKTIQVHMIFWNNIQNVLSELETIYGSKKYNI